jgi:hypothetical protein
MRDAGEAEIGRQRRDPKGQLVHAPQALDLSDLSRFPAYAAGR